MARFTRSARLLKPADFKQVFEAGVRQHSDCLTAVLRSHDEGEARLGMAIARKAVPTSVARNRIKRKIRESFRQRRAELGSTDIVILAKAAAAKASREALDDDLDRLWKRIQQRRQRS